MKAASSSNATTFPSIITRKAPTQQSPTRFRRTHFLKLGQSFSNNPFTRPWLNPFGSSFLSASSSFNAFIESTANGTYLGWNKAPEIMIDGGGEAEALRNTDKVTTVVLLGWLGATNKHLNKFVEWYNSRGIHAVTFLVELKDLLCLDPVSMLDRRIAELANGLATWGSEKEDDGRERCFIFHTFSNTGWLVYGSVIDRFQRREGLKEMIKGVIFDSGSADPLNPKVWAAGFAVAILKKLNNSKNGSENGVTDSKPQKAEPEMIEAVVLASLEKFFKSLLNMPGVERKFRAVVNAALEHHPHCPQLYLYSTADKVVPYKSVEFCINEMSNKGIKVFSLNFGTSPHVDHYRNFPNLYSSELHSFLKECFPHSKQK
ncbi:4-phosphopantetheine adenylyltransferase isoform 1 [Hibiscus syriacus]|uniref:4-phosphopantetheine adenylyltransferase isoform 1 n=1 Tax=Hibiscus syriacus TaxID=106335 RepID=A0A6A3CIK1_HIBSY|nr:transmembrane protein 53-like [Hibiscus syriacus]KAE8727118.1 4-phosphopantetheine adenylyltransferase isoform 1 [Hibiscus syriacus]